METEGCGLGQSHHVHAELLCHLCTVALTYPMLEETAHNTGRFSYHTGKRTIKAVSWKSAKYPDKF